MGDTVFESVVTIVAAISASVFFIWQIIAGWLVVNLELSIEAERQSINSSKDWLAFKLLFKKGKTDTLQIKDIKAIIREFDGSPLNGGIFSFEEIHKLNTDKNKIDFSSLNDDGKNISLSPDEAFHLGRCIEVTSGRPFIIEVALQGTRTFWGKGFQWRSSLVSLPVKI